MTITLDQLRQLDHVDLATWVKPLPVDSDRGNMMVEAAVASVAAAVGSRTELPDLAKFVVLEVARRGYTPRVQQESLGSRSVSYFQPGDPREGIYLSDEDLKQLGIASAELGFGVAFTSAPNGAGAWGRTATQTGRWPWSDDRTPL